MTARLARPRRRAAEAVLLAAAVAQRAVRGRPAAGLGTDGLAALAEAGAGAGLAVRVDPSGFGHLSAEAVALDPVVRLLHGRGWRVRLRPAPALTPRNRALVRAWARSGLLVRRVGRPWQVLAAGTARVLIDLEHRDRPASRVLVTLLEPAAAVAVPSQEVGVVSSDGRVGPTDGAAEVDVVITWVDDNDPAWRATLAAAGGDTAREGARWRDRGEGGLCLESVLLHLPWVRRVHVLTAGQVPSWLGTDDRVRLVDHREVFPDPADLPTFNSHAIEACLHRIPGLAERFVYLNDDVVVLAPLDPSDLHDERGRPVVALSHEIPAERAGAGAWWAAAAAAAALADHELGFVRRRMLAHAPQPLTRSVMAAAEQAHPAAFARVRGARLRSTADVAPVALSLQRALQQGEAVAGGPFTLDLQPGSVADAATAVELLDRLRPPAVCVNDGGRPGDPVAPVLAEVARLLAAARARMTP